MVTSAMKPPMKLQLEKVYLPCMLFAKKRYAGMKYEKRNAKPEFEAKGIETVRRDGCGVVRRILKRTLMALFTCGLKESKDDDRIVPISTLRQVRAEIEREWRDILSGNVSLRDLTFWKGVRLGTLRHHRSISYCSTQIEHFIRYIQKQSTCCHRCDGDADERSTCQTSTQGTCTIRCAVRSTRLDI